MTDEEIIQKVLEEDYKEYREQMEKFQKNDSTIEILSFSDWFHIESKTKVLPLLQKAIHLTKSETRKKAIEEVFEKLDKKMSEVDLSGGSYGQLEADETKPTKTINREDYGKLKKEMIEQC